MKKLLVLSLFVCMSAHALKFSGGISKATGAGDVSLTSFTKAWDTGISCVKDGSKLLEVNDNFRKLGLVYADCSNGKMAKKHRKLGFSVNVYQLRDLPTAVIKQIKGIK